MSFFTRRDFLKQSSLLSTSLMFSKLFGQVRFLGPNERINLACVGIGNRAAELILELYKTGRCNIVALCDVDIGAQHTLSILQMFPNVPRFRDFRVMFDQMHNQIDAVSVGVPDFSHFPITMMAIDYGKHVYVEKPLARTFQEVELLMKKAERFPKVVTQMGNQGHSGANYFQFKAWVEAGIIKDVTRIDAHMNNTRRWHGWDINMNRFPKEELISDTMDWDLWQAHTMGHSYSKDFVNGNWRCWYDFGMGALGDWGAHIMDSAHEFLELGLPTSIEAVKLEGHNSFFFPYSSTIAFKFPARKNMPAVDVTWYDGVNNLPEIPAGYGVSGLDPQIPPPSNGQLEHAKLNPGKIIYSNDYIFKGGSHSSVLHIIPEEKAKEMASKLPEYTVGSNHYENFFKACTGGEIARSPFSVSGPLSQLFCLGVISQRLNTTLDFDAKKKEITNNKFADSLLAGPPPRKGWEGYYNI